MDSLTLKKTAEEHSQAGRLQEAISCYRALIAQFPSDPGTWLRLGDLYTRVADHVGAIQAYDNVGRYYHANGLPLKAISVFRHTRSLILSSAPAELPHYLHVAVCTAECCEQLSLPADAFTAYAEAASDFMAVGQHARALDVWARMSRLAPRSPLPYLSAGEHFLAQKDVDEAVAQFRQALDVLLQAEKHLEAIKVCERILKFHKNAEYARLSAELRLEREERPQTLMAIRDLQMSHGLEPGNLVTMRLLIRAFEALEQGEKGVAVRKELARVALAQEDHETFEEALAELQQLVPEDEDVLELEEMRRGRNAGPAEQNFAETVFDDSPVGTTNTPSSPPPSESQPRSTGPHSQSDSRLRNSLGDAWAAREKMLAYVEDQIDEGNLHAAAEPLREAIHQEPASLLLREKLRDLYAQMNYAAGVRNETNAIAAIHAQNGNFRHALRLVSRVLAETPDDQTALQLKQQLERVPSKLASSE